MTAGVPGSEQVVLASDRGPVQFDERDGRLQPSRRNGSVTALLTGIGRTLSNDVVWVAPSAAPDDARASALGLFDELTASLGFRYDAVPIGLREYDQYYYDAGVRIIWSAWHGIEDDVPIALPDGDPLSALTGYLSVNRAVADKITATAENGALVSVHDYQLMAVPAMVRGRRRDVSITHFSHTPFPSRESLSQLPAPVVRTVVHGMLGADLLGFQRVRWARRFLDCCEQLGLVVDHTAGWVRHRGGQTWIRCYPVTVDSAALVARARSPQVTRWARRITTQDRRRVIARVDRLDPAKNAVRGFEAYARLLHSRPELARQLRFVACLIPSREQLPDYRRYADHARQLIQEVNHRYPGSITTLHGDDQDRALGVLRVHDVLLVNSVSDGMNLVVQEGVLLNEKDGVTVLSAGAGAADLLPAAIRLEEPKSIESTVSALHRALTLTPGHRRQLACQARAAIEDAKPVDWLTGQLADLRAVRAGCPPLSPLR